MVVGRFQEVKIMKRLLNSSQSELLAMYGRRRVGKTFLIREVYKQNIIFELTGLYKGKIKEQLQNFHTQIKQNSSSASKVEPQNWLEAFHQLGEFVSKKKSKKKKVIFIDEFPWIDSKRSGFLRAFEHFWNSYCTKRNDLVVVVCGSAASFMVNKIIKNRGGLHNRLSQIIQLFPFDLHEVSRFLESRKIKLNNYDILKLYMVVGGVPQYLNMVNREESIMQNIDRLSFSKNGMLTNEFGEVFQSLFVNSEVHETIIRTLAKSKKGLLRNKLLEECKMESSGVFSKALVELSESGFISYYSPFGKKAKGRLYRLSDEYSLFYLKFIEPNLGQGEGTWAKILPKQSYKIWSGFVFESICLKHVEQIKKELGVAKIYSIHSSWNNVRAQIDLIIDRDDGIINLCEMKFYEGLYTIDKTEYENLKNKIFQFKQDTKTRKNVFITMITTNGIYENENSSELINNKLNIDCLFEPKD